MTSTDTALLVLNDVHCRLGSSHILQGVNMSIPEGRVTALLGRNGVGKTTTLRSIMGLNGATGSIRFRGSEMSNLPPHRIALSGIGYVPEDRDVFHGLTVAENLRLAERPGSPPRYDVVYELFPELKQRAKQSAGTLSGGQQQMVSVARALLHETPLLLIDEPTKGLAPKVVSELVDVLVRVGAQTTVLMVEQNLAVAQRLANNVIIMDRGKVVAEGEAAEIMADRESLQYHLGVARHNESETEQ